MGEFLAGVALTLFFGFLANRFGYLSVHGKAPKPPRSGGVTGGGGSRPRDTHEHLD